MSKAEQESGELEDIRFLQGALKIYIMSIINYRLNMPKRFVI